MEANAEPRAHEPSRGSVVVVDDDEATRRLYVFALDAAGLRGIEAASAEEALALILADPGVIDAVLLDVWLPGMNGVELLRTLKSTPETMHIPVIMLTASGARDRDIVLGVELGASDYLAKPCSPSVIVAKVRSVRAQATVERKLRSELRDASMQAMIDPLTQLYNRRSFEARLVEASAVALRRDEPFSVVMLDLDRFKAINDQHGHAEGDRFLVHFSNTIHAVLRADDVAFRYGGDEFMALLANCDASRAVEVAKRLRAWLEMSPFCFTDGSQQVIAFSAGVAAARRGERYAGDGLVKRADVALYRAKTAGGGRVEH